MSEQHFERSIFERTMAFAGILQAISQVQHLARHGDCDAEQLSAALNTLLVTESDSTEEIYGSRHSLGKGYHLIMSQLGDKGQKDMEVTRYLIGILALERKLARSSKSFATLGERIAQVHRQLQHFSITDEQVVANFASIYSDVISNLGPKIQISGNPTFLQQTLVQHKIRALLLSAIRSAVLWRQLGGKRRQLVFSRKAIVNEAKKITPYRHS